ncbi:MAG TPA: hypothetical protein VEX68_21320 [Bryobacteraceae bacterium]|nr:hypothetical protein [Bryobacteraceae bacterium]
MAVSTRVPRNAGILKDSMRAVSLLLLLITVRLASAQIQNAGIDEAVLELSVITGWKPLKKVQHDTMDRTALKRYLEEKVQEEIKPEEIRAEEIALKKLGFVPQDFDLSRTMIDLLTEQAAAFYDYKKKKLFLLDGGDPAAQSMVVFHELAHALADQRFDLNKFIRKGKSDDSSLARMAVMEGQATWLMMESTSRKAGQSLKDLPPAILDMANRNGDAASQYPVLAAAPLYIRASLLFPYAEGLRFNHMVVQKEGQAGFARVFREPPVSSQQIMHPDAYFANTRPIDVALPKLPDERGWRMVTSGTLGEFDHAILLEQYGLKDQARAIASHWRGSSAAVIENKRDKRPVLLYASEWETAEDARKMFEAYRGILKGKWKSMTVVTDTPTSLTGSGDDGDFRVSLTGTRVSSIEGLPPTPVAAVN